MTTNEERREVANKFRREADNEEPFVTASIVGLSDLSYGDWKASRNDADCWSWLADLIEPEPEVDRDALLYLAQDLEVSVMDSGASGDMVGLVLDIVAKIRKACGEIE